MDYRRAFNIIKDMYQGASEEDVKTVLSLMGYEEPVPTEEEPETIEITPVKGEITMPTTKNTLTSAMSPTPAPVPTETVADFRRKLFRVYPELSKIYEDICNSDTTTLSTRWFSNAELGKQMARFVNFIEYIDVCELFPNFASIKRAAELTDGGTVSIDIRSMQKYICECSFKMNTADEGGQAMIYRDIVQYILKTDKEEKKEIDTIICETAKFCGLDIEIMQDMYKAEVEFNLIFK